MLAVHRWKPCGAFNHKITGGNGVEQVPRHERANVVESVRQWETVGWQAHFDDIVKKLNVGIARLRQPQATNPT